MVIRSQPLRAFRETLQGGLLYRSEQCPFSYAHKDGAYAIQFANGAIHAGCHHDSCGGGSQRWQELREKYEPGKKRPVSNRTAPRPGSCRVPHRALRINTRMRPCWSCGPVTPYGPCSGPSHSITKATRR